MFKADRVYLQEVSVQQILIAFIMQAAQHDIISLFTTLLTPLMDEK